MCQFGGLLRQPGKAAILEVLFRSRREIVLLVGEPVGVAEVNAAKLEELVAKFQEQAESLLTITSPVAEAT